MADQSAKKLHEEGVALFRRGNYQEALAKLETGIEAAGDDTRKTAEIYNDMGVVQTQLEDYEAAYESLEEAMALFEELDDEKGQAQTLGNLAAVYQAAGHPEEAIETYKEAAAMLEDLGEGEMAMYVWQAISKIRMKQGQYIAAIGAYEEGVENMPKKSFKRKILSKILSAPNSLIGTGGGSTSADDNDDDDDDATS